MSGAVAPEGVATAKEAASAGGEDLRSHRRERPAPRDPIRDPRPSQSDGKGPFRKGTLCWGAVDEKPDGDLWILGIRRMRKVPVCHRIWECPESATARERVRSRLRPGDQDAFTLLSAFRAARGPYGVYAEMAATRGAIPDLAPGEAMPDPEVVEMVGPTASPISWEGTIYTDGSCYNHRDISKPRAGYGVALMSDDGALVAIFYGAVPHTLPQTAAAGEAFAVLRALERFTGPVTIASDNAAVAQCCGDLRNAARS